MVAFKVDVCILAIASSECGVLCHRLKISGSVPVFGHRCNGVQFSSLSLVGAKLIR